MSLFTNIINAVKTVIGGFRKVPISQVILDIIGYIPNILIEIQNLINIKKDGFNKEEQFQLCLEALDEFDNLTGQEGLTVIKDMPKDKEEETLDCLKKVIENMVGHKLKIEGYYQIEKHF